MSDIQHIVYDIGRVLIEYDPERPFKKLIPDDTKRAWFFENVCTNDWNLEQDRGRPWVEAEAVLIEQFPEEETLIRAFRKHWHEMVFDAIHPSVAIYEKIISTGYDVTLLTNFSQETFPEAEEIFPFLKLARGATVSGDVRLLKPDAAIYDHHTAAFDLDPNRTLFIDDSPKNVDGARAFGWQAEQFSSAQQWQSDLSKHGIVL